jgi:large subunit ribosomal protein L18
MNVYRSLSNIYVQIIDDEAGHTLISASTLDPEIQKSVAKLTKSEQARKVGELAAERAKSKKIEKVVFDRGGYRYFGRIKALAEGARDKGLKF